MPDPLPPPWVRQCLTFGQIFFSRRPLSWNIFLSSCLSVCLSAGLYFYLSDILLTLWTTFVLTWKLRSWNFFCTLLSSTMDMRTYREHWNTIKEAHEICLWNIHYPCDKCDKPFDQEKTCSIWPRRHFHSYTSPFWLWRKKIKSPTLDLGNGRVFFLTPIS